MIETLTFRDQIESSRPPGAPKRETKALLMTPLRFRGELGTCLDGIELNAFLLDETELDELAIALTELAEDLPKSAGLWKNLEAYHREFFSVSLPLLCRAGERLRGNASPPLSEDRNAIRHQPFFTVAELGGVFRDQPWKTLDFATAKSGDGTLLDYFSINEVGETPIVAGRVNLNLQGGGFTHRSISGISLLDGGIAV